MKVTLLELETTWSLDDALEAGDVIDAIEEAEDEARAIAEAEAEQQRRR